MNKERKLKQAKDQFAYAEQNLEGLVVAEQNADATYQAKIDLSDCAHIDLLTAEAEKMYCISVMQREQEILQNAVAELYDPKGLPADKASKLAEVKKAEKKYNAAKAATVLAEKKAQDALDAEKAAQQNADDAFLALEEAQEATDDAQADFNDAQADLNDAQADLAAAQAAKKKWRPVVVAAIIVALLVWAIIATAFAARDDATPADTTAAPADTTAADTTAAETTAEETTATETTATETTATETTAPETTAAAAASTTTTPADDFDAFVSKSTGNLRILGATVEDTVEEVGFTFSGMRLYVYGTKEELAAYGNNAKAFTKAAAGEILTLLPNAYQSEGNARRLAEEAFLQISYYAGEKDHRTVISIEVEQEG